MIRSKKEKRIRMAAISARLQQLYPNAECALEFGADPWRLLVMARLSAQCTDARVNIVSRELFAKYPDAASMAEADISDIENIVRPCGLYRTKAESIKEASRIIAYELSGKIPDTMEGLLALPGVGRKIANLILGDVFGKGAIVCDTHCIRICARLGMYSEDLKDATRVEFILRDIMDVEGGSDFCHRIVTFGREVCTARAPKCKSCPMADLCEHNLKAIAKDGKGAIHNE